MHEPPVRARIKPTHVSRDLIRVSISLPPPFCIHKSPCSRCKENWLLNWNCPCWQHPIGRFHHITNLSHYLFPFYLCTDDETRVLFLFSYRDWAMSNRVSCTRSSGETLLEQVAARASGRMWEVIVEVRPIAETGYARAPFFFFCGGGAVSSYLLSSERSGR